MYIVSNLTQFSTSTTDIAGGTTVLHVVNIQYCNSRTVNYPSTVAFAEDYVFEWILPFQFQAHPHASFVNRRPFSRPHVFRENMLPNERNCGFGVISYKKVFCPPQQRKTGHT